jgi:hypothetical protein
MPHSTAKGELADLYFIISKFAAALAVVPWRWAIHRSHEREYVAALKKDPLTRADRSQIVSMAKRPSGSLFTGWNGFLAGTAIRIR